MNKSSYKTILAVIAMTVFGAGYAAAQTGHQHESSDKKAPVQASKKAQGHADQDMSEMDKSVMMNEPHHVLVDAYNESIAAFARALRDQAQRGALSSDFARAAVAEIGRSLDQAEEHHREHVKTMSPDLRAKMPAMMKQMAMRISKVRDAFNVLEKDVGEYTLNSKQIATDSAELLRCLDGTTKMHSPE